MKCISILLAVAFLQGPANTTERKAEQPKSQIGREVAIARHLTDGEEFRIPITDLVAFGQKLFEANWTEQEGGGRPMMKGTGKPLSDLDDPLVGVRAFNPISATDA